MQLKIVYMESGGLAPNYWTCREPGCPMAHLPARTVEEAEFFESTAVDLIADHVLTKALNPDVEDHLVFLRQAAGQADAELRNGQLCPRDTNGDGDCGQPACPVCGPKHLRPL